MELYEVREMMAKELRGILHDELMLILKNTMEPQEITGATFTT